MRPLPRARRPLAPAVLAAVLALLAASTEATEPSRPAPEATSWTLREAVTTLAFDEALLDALGLAVAEVADLAGAAAPPPHPLSVAAASSPRFAATAPAGLRVAVRDSTFVGFAGAPLRHRGGLVLRGPAGRLDLAGVVLSPAGRPFALDLLDAAGAPLLGTAQAQWELDAEAGRLRYFNADLRILPELARRLGDERLAGTTVGVLALDAELQVGPALRPPAETKGAAPPPCGDWSGTVDVALTRVESVSQCGAVLGGRVVVVPSVTLENAGTANVPWWEKFTGPFEPYDNDQHPFLVWQMLRDAGGVLAPIGRSDLKHAFATGNDGCEVGACTDLHILGLGCADTYGISSNTWNAALAPREELTASTGVWAHCDEPSPAIPTHFDSNGDCEVDHTGAGEDCFSHGMAVATADLDDAGARYFVEAFYVVRDDVDIFDSMGFREVAPAPVSSIWTFPAAAPFALGPAIDGWVDPGSPGPGEGNELLDSGEGRLQLAVRVTELGGGRRRYAYALQNHDFDRRIAAFHLPFEARWGLAGIAFADGDGVAANDWAAVADASGVTWTAPAGNELDWGTLFSFVLESDQTPGTASAELDVHEAGAPGSLAVATLVPFGLFADDFESGDASAWSSAVP